MSEQNNKPQAADSPGKDGKKDNDSFEAFKKFFTDPLVTAALGGLAGFGLGNSGKNGILELETRKREELEIKREQLEKSLKRVNEEIELLKKENQKQKEEILRLEIQLEIKKKEGEQAQKQLAGLPEEKKLIHYLNETNYRRPSRAYGKISID